MDKRNIWDLKEKQFALFIKVNGIIKMDIWLSKEKSAANE